MKSWGVEVKAVTAMLLVYQAQTLTYMRLAKCPAGLLINFNVPKLMDGVKRLVNPRASYDQRMSSVSLLLCVSPFPP